MESGTNCYRAFSHLVEWKSYAEAEESCRESDGNLVSIKHKWEHQFVKVLIYDPEDIRYLIGARHDSGGTWHWTKNDEDLSYKDWLGSVPQRGYYALMHSKRGKWVAGNK